RTPGPPSSPARSPGPPTGLPTADEAGDRPAARRRPRARHPRLPLLARRLSARAHVLRRARRGDVAPRGPDNRLADGRAVPAASAPPCRRGLCERLRGRSPRLRDRGGRRRRVPVPPAHGTARAVRDPSPRAADRALGGGGQARGLPALAAAARGRTRTGAPGRAAGGAPHGLRRPSSRAAGTADGARGLRRRDRRAVPSEPARAARTAAVVVTVCVRRRVRRCAAGQASAPITDTP